eukprot:Rhum_TRINITY_DN14832_c11_g10::Rhum_TRINITY_DN14832_c11_g10_i1::g.124786::m.124786
MFAGNHTPSEANHSCLAAPVLAEHMITEATDVASWLSATQHQKLEAPIFLLWAVGLGVCAAEFVRQASAYVHVAKLCLAASLLLSEVSPSEAVTVSACLRLLEVGACLKVASAAHPKWRACATAAGLAAHACLEPGALAVFCPVHCCATFYAYL